MEPGSAVAGVVEHAGQPASDWADGHRTTSGSRLLVKHPRVRRSMPVTPMHQAPRTARSTAPCRGNAMHADLRHRTCGHLTFVEQPSIRGRTLIRVEPAPGRDDPTVQRSFFTALHAQDPSKDVAACDTTSPSHRICASAQFCQSPVVHFSTTEPELSSGALIERNKPWGALPCQTFG